MIKIQKRIFDYIYIILGLPWLILVMAYARGHTSIKILGLLILLVVALMEIAIYKVEIKTKYIVTILAFICICISSLLLGVMSGYKFNSDDYVLIQYYIIIPIASLILAMIFYEDKRINSLKKWLIFINFYINTFNLLYFLAQKNVIPQFGFLNMGILASAQVKNNQLFLRMSNEPALIFLMPFVIISFYDLNSYDKKFRILSFIGAFIGIIYAFLSGRKALQVTILISILYLIFLLLKELKIKRIVKYLCIFLIFIIGISISLLFMSDILGLESIFDSAINTFINGVSKSDYGIIKRSSNIVALLEGWCKNGFTIIFGSGLNSYTKNSIAGSNTLWSYEVFYPAFLYQTGIVGMLSFFIIVFGIISRLNYKIKTMNYSNDYRAIKIAFICILIATGSNPLIYNIWLWAIVCAFII